MFWSERNGELTRILSVSLFVHITYMICFGKINYYVLFFQALHQPSSVIEENYQDRRSPAPVRVEKMCEALMRTHPGPPLFLLCILPERKNSDIYGFCLFLDLLLPKKKLFFLF